MLNVLICLATSYNLKPYQDNFNLNGERLITAPLLVSTKEQQKRQKNIQTFVLFLLTMKVFMI